MPRRRPAPTTPTPPARLAHPLPTAVQAAEIAWAAPQVIALRSLRMLAAGHSPSARDRREFTVMGTEKLLALQRSWAAMGAEALRTQQTLALQAWAQGLAWLTQPWTAWSGAGARAQMEAAQHLHGAWDRLAQAGLRPVHRRVTANARRLRRG